MKRSLGNAHTMQDADPKGMVCGHLLVKEIKIVSKPLQYKTEKKLACTLACATGAGRSSGDTVR
jgi:hypothetical protein